VDTFYTPIQRNPIFGAYLSPYNCIFLQMCSHALCCLLSLPTVRSLFKVFVSSPPHVSTTCLGPALRPSAFFTFFTIIHILFCNRYLHYGHDIHARKQRNATCAAPAGSRCSYRNATYVMSVPLYRIMLPMLTSHAAESPYRLMNYMVVPVQMLHATPSLTVSELRKIKRVCPSCC
jgi:hypothetical protein